MGLLEKAQQKKAPPKQTEDTSHVFSEETLKEQQEPIPLTPTPKGLKISSPKKKTTTGPLEKAQQQKPTPPKKQSIPQEKQQILKKEPLETTKGVVCARTAGLPPPTHST